MLNEYTVFGGLTYYIYLLANICNEQNAYMYYCSSTKHEKVLVDL